MIHPRFVIRVIGLIGAAVCATLLSPVYAAQDTAMPQPASGDFVAHDFDFSNGTTLPEVRIHYTTLGTLQRDAQGHATNAVLLLHGTTGTGRTYLAPAFQHELFAPGAPLDASRYFIVMPDGLGRGDSTKRATACTHASPTTAIAT